MKLASEFPDVATRIETALVTAGQDDLAAQIAEVEVIRWTYDEDVNASYIYVQSSREVNAVETNIIGVKHGETVIFKDDEDAAVDVDNFGRLTGIELLNFQVSPTTNFGNESGTNPRSYIEESDEQADSGLLQNLAQPEWGQLVTTEGTDDSRTQKNEPRGLAGWLLLYCLQIGLFVLVGVYQMLVFDEIIIGIFSLCLGGFVLFSLSKQGKSWPRTFNIGVSSVALAFTVSEVLGGRIAVTSNPTAPAELQSGGSFGAVFWGSIWLAYWIFSKRVKNTYPRKKA